MQQFIKNGLKRRKLTQHDNPENSELQIQIQSKISGINSKISQDLNQQNTYIDVNSDSLKENISGIEGNLLQKQNQQIPSNQSQQLVRKPLTMNLYAPINKNLTQKSILSPHINEKQAEIENQKCNDTEPLEYLNNISSSQLQEQPLFQQFKYHRISSHNHCKRSVVDYILELPSGNKLLVVSSVASLKISSIDNSQPNQSYIPHQSQSCTSQIPYFPIINVDVSIFRSILLLCGSWRWQNIDVGDVINAGGEQVDNYIQFQIGGKQIGNELNRNNNDSKFIRRKKRKKILKQQIDFDEQQSDEFDSSDQLADQQEENNSNQQQQYISEQQLDNEVQKQTFILINEIIDRLSNHSKNSPQIQQKQSFSDEQNRRQNLTDDQLKISDQRIKKLLPKFLTAKRKQNKTNFVSYLHQQQQQQILNQQLSSSQIQQNIQQYNQNIEYQYIWRTKHHFTQTQQNISFNKLNNHHNEQNNNNKIQNLNNNISTQISLAVSEIIITDPNQSQNQNQISNISYITINPHIFLSPSILTDTPTFNYSNTTTNQQQQCDRYSVLKQMFCLPEEYVAAMIYGNIVHSLFQMVAAYWGKIIGDGEILNENEYIGQKEQQFDWNCNQNEQQQKQVLISSSQFNSIINNIHIHIPNLSQRFLIQMVNFCIISINQLIIQYSSQLSMCSNVNSLEDSKMHIFKFILPIFSFLNDSYKIESNNKQNNENNIITKTNILNNNKQTELITKPHLNSITVPLNSSSNIKQPLHTTHPSNSIKSTQSVSLFTTLKKHSSSSSVTTNTSGQSLKLPPSNQLQQQQFSSQSQIFNQQQPQLNRTSSIQSSSSSSSSSSLQIPLLNQINSLSQSSKSMSQLFSSLPLIQSQQQQLQQQQEQQYLLQSNTNQNQSQLKTSSSFSSLSTDTSNQQNKQQQFQQDSQQQQQIQNVNQQQSSSSLSPTIIPLKQHNSSINQKQLNSKETNSNINKQQKSQSDQKQLLLPYNQYSFQQQSDSSSSNQQYIKSFIQSEEHITSLTFGIHGYVDATILVQKFQHSQQQQIQKQSNSSSKLFPQQSNNLNQQSNQQQFLSIKPLELKSGNPWLERKQFYQNNQQYSKQQQNNQNQQQTAQFRVNHSIQVFLYEVMMREVYNIPNNKNIELEKQRNIEKLETNHKLLKIDQNDQFASVGNGCILYIPPIAYLQSQQQSEQQSNNNQQHNSHQQKDQQQQQQTQINYYYFDVELPNALFIQILQRRNELASFLEKIKRRRIKLKLEKENEQILLNDENQQQKQYNTNKKQQQISYLQLLPPAQSSYQALLDYNQSINSPLNPLSPQFQSISPISSPNQIQQQFLQQSSSSFSYTNIPTLQQSKHIDDQQHNSIQQSSSSSLSSSSLIQNQPQQTSLLQTSYSLPLQTSDQQQYPRIQSPLNNSYKSPKNNSYKSPQLISSPFSPINTTLTSSSSIQSIQSYSSIQSNEQCNRQCIKCGLRLYCGLIEMMMKNNEERIRQNKYNKQAFNNKKIDYNKTNIEQFDSIKDIEEIETGIENTIVDDQYDFDSDNENQQDIKQIEKIIVEKEDKNSKEVDFDEEEEKGDIIQVQQYQQQNEFEIQLQQQIQIQQQQIDKHNQFLSNQSQFFIFWWSLLLNEEEYEEENKDEDNAKVYQQEEETQIEEQGKEQQEQENKQNEKEIENNDKEMRQIEIKQLQIDQQIRQIEIEQQQIDQLKELRVNENEMKLELSYTKPNERENLTGRCISQLHPLFTFILPNNYDDNKQNKEIEQENEFDSSQNNEQEQNELNFEDEEDKDYDEQQQIFYSVLIRIKYKQQDNDNDDDNNNNNEQNMNQVPIRIRHNDILAVSEDNYYNENNLIEQDSNLSSNQYQSTQSSSFTSLNSISYSFSLIHRIYKNVQLNQLINKVWKKNKDTKNITIKNKQIENLDKIIEQQKIPQILQTHSFSQQQSQQLSKQTPQQSSHYQMLPSQCISQLPLLLQSPIKNNQSLLSMIQNQSKPQQINISKSLIQNQSNSQTYNQLNRTQSFSPVQSQLPFELQLSSNFKYYQQIKEQKINNENLSQFIIDTIALVVQKTIQRVFKKQIKIINANILQQQSSQYNPHQSQSNSSLFSDIFVDLIILKSTKIPLPKYYIPLLDEKLKQLKRIEQKNQMNYNKSNKELNQIQNKRSYISSNSQSIHPLLNIHVFPPNLDEIQNYIKNEIENEVKKIIQLENKQDQRQFGQIDQIEQMDNIQQQINSDNNSKLALDLIQTSSNQKSLSQSHSYFQSYSSQYQFNKLRGLLMMLISEQDIDIQIEERINNDNKLIIENQVEQRNEQNKEMDFDEDSNKLLEDNENNNIQIENYFDIEQFDDEQDIDEILLRKHRICTFRNMIFNSETIIENNNQQINEQKNEQQQQQQNEIDLMMKMLNQFQKTGNKIKEDNEIYPDERIQINLNEQQLLALARCILPYKLIQSQIIKQYQSSSFLPQNNQFSLFTPKFRIIPIVGLPGTGKTHLITNIVKWKIFIGEKIQEQRLRKQINNNTNDLINTNQQQQQFPYINYNNNNNNRMLLLAYTHNAVDNICIRLMNMKIPFLRIGNEEKVCNEIKKGSILYSQWIRQQNQDNQEVNKKNIFEVKERKQKERNFNRLKLNRNYFLYIPDQQSYNKLFNNSSYNSTKIQQSSNQQSEFPFVFSFSEQIPPPVIIYQQIPVISTTTHSFLSFYFKPSKYFSVLDFGHKTNQNELNNRKNTDKDKNDQYYEQNNNQIFINSPHIKPSTLFPLHFSLSIIDEASQLLLPFSFPAIFSSDSVVLVGDNNQLPPIVHYNNNYMDNNENEQEIMNQQNGQETLYEQNEQNVDFDNDFNQQEQQQQNKQQNQQIKPYNPNKSNHQQNPLSLLTYFSLYYPESVIILRVQHRMNESICDVVNKMMQKANRIGCNSNNNVSRVKQVEKQIKDKENGDNFDIFDDFDEQNSVFQSQQSIISQSQYIINHSLQLITEEEKVKNRMLCQPNNMNEFMIQSNKDSKINNQNKNNEKINESMKLILDPRHSVLFVNTDNITLNQRKIQTKGNNLNTKSNNEQYQIEDDFDSTNSDNELISDDEYENNTKQKLKTKSNENKSEQIRSNQKEAQIIALIVQYLIDFDCWHEKDEINYNQNNNNEQNELNLMEKDIWDDDIDDNNIEIKNQIGINDNVNNNNNKHELKEQINQISQAIGIIAPYHAQVNQIRQSIQNLAFKQQKEQQLQQNHNHTNNSFIKLHSFIDINTIDSFQGKEKSIIILSLTHPEIIDELNTYEIGLESGNTLLSDWRRLYVALTRARCKLIIVGSTTAMRAMTEIQNNSIEGQVNMLPTLWQQFHNVEQNIQSVSVFEQPTFVDIPLDFTLL